MERIPIEGYKGLEISYQFLNMYEMLFLLSNNNGFLDGDKRCLVIPVT